jgi:UPF0288 family protein (methanogenesis marker protein 3)
VNIPEEWELIEFFGSAEYKSKPEDGFHCYELIAEASLSIEFSLNIFQGSVQVKLRLKKEEVLNIYQEGVVGLSIEGRPTGKVLMVSFDIEAENSSLILRLDPAIHVAWEQMIE